MYFQLFSVASCKSHNQGYHHWKPAPAPWLKGFSHSLILWQVLICALNLSSEDKPGLLTPTVAKKLPWTQSHTCKIEVAKYKVQIKNGVIICVKYHPFHLGMAIYPSPQILGFSAHFSIHACYVLLLKYEHLKNKVQRLVLLTSEMHFTYICQSCGSLSENRRALVFK